MSDESHTPDRYHPLAKCEECPLRDAHGYVPSSPGDGDVAIIGEAPTPSDVKAGYLLSDRTGALLPALARQAGVDDMLGPGTVTNVVACAPPTSKSGKKKKPPVAAQRACAPRLREELKDKHSVVALGKTAAEAMLGRRSSVREARMGPPETVSGEDTEYGLKLDVLVTYSPGSALRAPRRQGDIVRDLRKLTADPPEWEDPEYVVIRTPAEAVRVLDQLPEGDTPLALDIETAGSPEAAIPQPERLTCAGLATRTDRVNVLLPEALVGEGKRAFEAALRRRPVLCHNGKFDLQALAWLGFDVPPLGADTLLAAYCLDERRGGKSLEQLAREYLGAPRWKGDAGENLYLYNARDVAATLMLWQQFRPRLEAQGVAELHAMLCRASDMLWHVEQRGMRVDTEGLERADQELRQELEDLEAATTQWVDNPRSPKQIKEALQELGVDAKSTDKRYLGKLTREGGPPAQLATSILDYRKTQKLHSTYVANMPDYMVNGRVHSDLSAHKTETGRLASSGPNLQNQPKVIRQVFVADSGKVFVEGDLASAELRVIAVESGDEGLAEVFRSGEKLHAIVAEEVWGSDWTSDHYRLSKTVVYGLAYGRTAYGIGMGLGIGTDEAGEIVTGYYRRFPKVEAWQDDIKTKVRTGYPLRTAFGRKLRLPKPTRLMSRSEVRRLYRQALAFVPQSTASDITLTAALILHEQGWRILMLVHDSILIETVPERADEARRAMEEAVREAGRRYTDAVPFLIEVDEPRTRW